MSTAFVPACSFEGTADVFTLLEVFVALQESCLLGAQVQQPAPSKPA